MKPVYVIRTTEVDRTRAFFEQLGLTFVEEKHGRGPTHFAHEADNAVLEIYPAKKNNSADFIKPVDAAPVMP